MKIAHADGKQQAPEQLVASVHRVILNVTPPTASSNTASDCITEYDLETPPVLLPGQQAEMHPLVSIRAICKHTPIQSNESKLEPEIMDFELQRQVKQADLSWSKWTRCDIDVAYSILERVLEYELSPEPLAFNDRTISMPLPSRVVGAYTNSVFHPELTEHGFSPNTSSELVAYHQALYRVHENSDIYSRGKSPTLHALLETAASDEEAKKIQAWHVQEERAKRLNMKLFRYMDFDIEPSKQYRYRVRLETIDSDRKRRYETGWSDVSQEITVPADFVTELDGNRALHQWWQRYRDYMMRSKP